MISDALAVMKMAGVIMAVSAPYVVGLICMAGRHSPRPFTRDRCYYSTI